MMDTMRRVQRKNNDTWEDIHFLELKKGDTFRMFEPDGEPVVGNQNDTEFLAMSDVYKGVDEVLTIDIRQME